MTNEERIRKLREEVESLRSLLDRTQKRASHIAKSEDKPLKNKTKPRPKHQPKPDDDIPPF